MGRGKRTPPPRGAAPPAGGRSGRGSREEAAGNEARRRAGLFLGLARTPAGRAVDRAAEPRRRPGAKKKGGGADGTGLRLPAATPLPRRVGGGGVERSEHG